MSQAKTEAHRRIHTESHPASSNVRFEQGRDGQAATSDTRKPVATAELITPDGVFLIQERRATPREPGQIAPKAKALDYSASPQMMTLGGLIIMGVLVGSYTTKYDLAIGHVGGALSVPAIAFLALQLYLCRAAYRLYCDIHNFKSLTDYVQSRLLRYLPAVIPAVLLGYAIINVRGVPGFHATLASLPANLAMVADMVGVADIDSSHWRLKIEMIQSALVAMAWFGPMRRHLAPLLTVGLAISAVFITGEPARSNVLTLQGFMTSDGYLPLFVYGVALYQLTQDRGSLVWRTMLATSAVLVALSNTPAHAVAVLAALAVLSLIAMGYLKVLGRLTWLARLGAIAFPVYVVHYVMGFALINGLEALGCPAFASILAASAAAIGLGYLFHLVFERPAERYIPVLIMKIAVGIAAAGDLVTLPKASGATGDALSTGH